MTDKYVAEGRQRLQSRKDVYLMSIQSGILAFILRRQMADFYRDVSTETQRLKMAKYAQVVKLSNDVSRGPAKGCPIPAEWIATPKINQDLVLLYLHGGAYFLNYDNPHRDLAVRIGRGAQMRVLLPDFRLAPEHPYPAAIEDASNAYRWLLGQGYSPTNIAIAGDSSGGGLALATFLVIISIITLLQMK